MGIVVDRKPAIYLAGAMMYTPDNGGGWRDHVTPQLEAAGLEVLDPRNIEQYSRRPVDIVCADVAAIARSKYVLAYGGAPSWGTGMELWQAKQLSVKVITWLGVKNLPLSAWLRYTSDEIHDTLEGAVTSVLAWEIR